jgi:thiamine-monophosphate kinase
MSTLAELGEFEVIQRLRAVRSPAPGVIVGAGDDAAVTHPRDGFDLVTTADCFIEGTHFLPDWFTAREAGRRLATANLSDIAAMAATPRWAVESIGAPADRSVEWLEQFERGLDEALFAAEAGLVGGNITACPTAFFCLTLVGDVAPGAAWSRDGARAGDLLAVSGMPGRAGAAVRLAAALGDRARDPLWRDVLRAWIAPTARLELARRLAPLGVVSAAIDLSDGLAGDLGHVCRASAVGAEIDMAAWPEDPHLERAARELGAAPDDLRLGPSDDYELLLAVAPEGREACERVARDAGVPLHFIGRFTDAAAGITKIDGSGRRPLGGAGYDHFAQSES